MKRHISLLVPAISMPTSALAEQVITTIPTGGTIANKAANAANNTKFSNSLGKRNDLVTT
jgi:hypothetical protein